MKDERTIIKLTPRAREVLDNSRKAIFAETGILKPRYEIASEYIIAHHAALGGGK